MPFDVAPGALLGDLQAEADERMLSAAFFSTADSRCLIENADKAIVVGRRGTGKSALNYYLRQHFRNISHTRLISLAFDEAQVIGIGPSLACFQKDYRLVFATCKLVWRYALILEVASNLAGYFKFSHVQDPDPLPAHLDAWLKLGDDAITRFRRILDKHICASDAPERQIAELSSRLELNQLECAIDRVFDIINQQCVLLVDRLDDGYRPDGVGSGLVSGIVEAALYLKKRWPLIRPILFLRDNMFRTMVSLNPDYSRNVEGHVLRLHWDEYSLQSMVCKRLREAFSLTEESTSRVWAKCTTGDIKSPDGFKRCLKATLYRPRDILALLNEAFFNAHRQDRKLIAQEDVDKAAKEISATRLDCLHNEYHAIIPGLSHFTKAFAHYRPQMSAAEACRLLAPEMGAHDPDLQVAMELKTWTNPEDVLRALYSIGFIGAKDTVKGNYIFCHDGNRLDRDIQANDQVLVHPCFWMALNLKQDESSETLDATDIYDEYQISVTNEPLEARNQRLGQIISEQGNIPYTDEGEEAHARWCAHALGIVFAGVLHDLQSVKRGADAWTLSPINLGRSNSWKLMLEHYNVHSALFVITNSRVLDPEWMYRLPSLLSAAHGKVVFAVCRGDSAEARAGGELDHIRVLHKKHDVIVIKITTRYIAGLLGKLRNPAKHDVIDGAFMAHIRQYCAIYLKDHRFGDSQTRTTEKKSSAVATIDRHPDACYGELDASVASGAPVLKILARNPGPGRKQELCEPIQLKQQALVILYDGIARAKQLYIEEQKAGAGAKGKYADASECEPPPEWSFCLSWSRDDLAKLICNNTYTRLNGREKGRLKQALSRVRSLVHIDGKCFLTEPDETGERQCILRMRMKQ